MCSAVLLRDLQHQLPAFLAHEHLLLARLHAAFSSSSDRSTPNRSSTNDPEAPAVICRDERDHDEGGAVAVGRRAHGSWGSRSRPSTCFWISREGVAGSRSLTPGGPRVLADPARTARPAVGFALGRRERRVDAVEHARAGGAGDCVSACMSSGRVCCRDACTGRGRQALRDVLVYTWCSCLCDVLRAVGDPRVTGAAGTGAT